MANYFAEDVENQYVRFMHFINIEDLLKLSSHSIGAHLTPRSDPYIQESDHVSISGIITWGDGVSQVSMSAWANLTFRLHGR